MLETLFASLEASLPAALLRGSLWVYPAVNTGHIIGIAMLIGGIRAYALDNKAARDLSFGCEGEFATRWSSPVRREDLADLMREVYDQHFVLPEIDRIDLKFTLTADFIVTGFLQAVHSGDPMDDDILQEMQEAVIVYMDSWIGSPSKRNQS